MTLDAGATSFINMPVAFPFSNFSLVLPLLQLGFVMLNNSCCRHEVCAVPHVNYYLLHQVYK